MVTATGHDEGDHQMTETKETLDRDLLLRIYETVARIRAFDDKAQALIGKRPGVLRPLPGAGPRDHLGRGRRGASSPTTT